jgi:hypothetical protein
MGFLTKKIQNDGHKKKAIRQFEQVDLDFLA